MANRTLLLALCLFAPPAAHCAGRAAPAPTPRRVFVLVADGAGINALAHAHYHQFGSGPGSEQKKLAVETLPASGIVYTHCADSLVTDSAAAATALFTGFKTLKKALSITPDGRPLKTVFEAAAAAGKATGVVTTVPVTHATPAAAYAHVKSRKDYAEIFAWLLRNRPDVVMGSGAEKGKTPTEYLPSDFARQAADRGYAVCMDRESMEKADKLPLLCVFGGEQMPYELDRKAGPETYPRLAEMAMKATSLLSGDKDGFVLMVEGGLIDYGNHENRLSYAVAEVLEFDRMVAAVLDWVDKRQAWGDTLVVAVADHDTGELVIGDPHPAKGGDPEAKAVAVEKPAAKGELRPLQAGEYVPHAYGARDHSAAPVWVYAKGAGSDLFSGVMDNTRVGAILNQLVSPRGGR